MTIHQNSPCDATPVVVRPTPWSHRNRDGAPRTWTVWGSETPDADSLGEVISRRHFPLDRPWVVWSRRDQDYLRGEDRLVRRFRTPGEAARALQLASRPRVYRITLCRPVGEWSPTTPCMSVLAPGALQSVHAADLADALLRVDLLEGRA